MKPEGTHLIIDAYDVSGDPGETAVSLLRELAGLAQCHVLGALEYVFPTGGGGRTALLILSQSHASIHTWPENRYVAIDLYSCRKLDQSVTDQIEQWAQGRMGTCTVHMRVFERGTAAA